MNFQVITEADVKAELGFIFPQNANDWEKMRQSGIKILNQNGEDIYIRTRPRNNGNGTVKP